MCIIRNQQQSIQTPFQSKIRFTIENISRNTIQELDLEWNEVQSFENIDGLLTKLPEWFQLKDNQLTIEILTKEGFWQTLDRQEEGFVAWLTYNNTLRIREDSIPDLTAKDFGIFNQNFEFDDDLFYLDNIKHDYFDQIIANVTLTGLNNSSNPNTNDEDISSLLKLEPSENQQLDNQQTEYHYLNQQQSNFQNQPADSEIKMEQEFPRQAENSDDQFYSDSETRKHQLSDESKSVGKITRKRIEKFGRNGEKTVDEARKLVNKYLQISRENRKITKDKAAKELGQKKKTLDDYKLQLKIAKFLGFDFDAHKNDGMGKVRMFNEAKIKESSINRKQMIFNLQSIEDHEY